MPHTTVLTARARLHEIVSRPLRSDPSGSYEVGCDPVLVLHFRAGEPVYAEGTDVPDLGARLVARGCLAPDQRERLFTRSAQPLGERLLEAGVPASELAEVTRETVVDALLGLALDVCDDVEVRPARSAGPLGLRAAASLDDVVAEAGDLADRLTGAGITTATVLARGSDPTRPVVLSDAEWAVVWRADGRTQLRDLCCITGRGTAEILRATLTLVEAGLWLVAGDGPTLDDVPVMSRPAAPVDVAVPVEAEPGPGLVDVGFAPITEPSGITRPAPDPEPEAVPEPAPTVEYTEPAAIAAPPGTPPPAPAAEPDALPQRRRGGTVWDLMTRGDGKGGTPSPVVEPVETPDLDLVRRILKGLRDL